MAITPTVNRLQLGSVLRHVREDAKLTQGQLGAVVFPKASDKVQQVRIAKVESGDRQLHEADLRSILAACDVTDPDLLALLDQLHTNAGIRGRWAGYRAVYSEPFRKWVDLETDAAWMRECALELVPDLCQTEAYVRALFGLQLDEGLLAGEDFPAAVRARRARQEVLLPERENGMPPVAFHVVMSESCVRRIVGNRAVMAEQLQHLIAMSQWPNVTIQLIPFNASVSGVVFAPYSMLRIPVPGAVADLDFAYMTVGATPLYMDDKAAVQWYEHNFQAVSTSALRSDDTRDFLKEIKREYRYR